MPDRSWRQSPLANLAIHDRHESKNFKENRVTLLEAEADGKINVRLNPGNYRVRNAVEAILGCEFPLKENRAVEVKGISVLWLGPEEWLVITSEDERRSLLENLSSAVVNEHTAVTDISDSLTVIRLSGQAARDVLEKGCSIDLHPNKFQKGYCAQTHLARARVILHQTNDSPAYDIYVSWSYSAYLWSWLEDAGQNFGITVSSNK